MAHGYLASECIYQQIMVERGDVKEPKLHPMREVPPMIALAVGKKAATYSPSSGVKCDEEQMKIFFGEDLGFDGCWAYLKLSEKPDASAAHTKAELPQTAPYRQAAEKTMGEVKPVLTQ